LLPHQVLNATLFLTAAQSRVARLQEFSAHVDVLDLEGIIMMFRILESSPACLEILSYELDIFFFRFPDVVEPAKQLQRSHCM